MFPAAKVNWSGPKRWPGSGQVKDTKGMGGILHYPFPGGGGARKINKTLCCRQSKGPNLICFHGNKNIIFKFCSPASKGRQFCSICILFVFKRILNFWKGQRGYIFIRWYPVLKYYFEHWIEKLDWKICLAKIIRKAVSLFPSLKSSDEFNGSQWLIEIPWSLYISNQLCGYFASGWAMKCLWRLIKCNWRNSKGAYP